MIPTLLVEKLRLSEANNTLTFWNVNRGYTFWMSSLSDSVLKSQETQQGVLVLWINQVIFSSKFKSFTLSLPFTYSELRYEPEECAPSWDW